MKKVQVGRFDNNKQIEVDDNTTVKQALTQAGFTMGDNEVIRDISNKTLEGNETVEDGRGYFLVTKVKSGKQKE